MIIQKSSAFIIPRILSYRKVTTYNQAKGFSFHKEGENVYILNTYCLSYTCFFSEYISQSFPSTVWTFLIRFRDCPKVYIRNDHNTSTLGQGPKSSIIAVGVLEDQNIASLFLIEIWNKFKDRQKKLGIKLLASLIGGLGWDLQTNRILWLSFPCSSFDTLCFKCWVSLTEEQWPQSTDTYACLRQLLQKVLGQQERKQNNSPMLKLITASVWLYFLLSLSLSLYNQYLFSFSLIFSSTFTPTIIQYQWAF